MKHIIQQIIEKSGKNTAIQFEGKERSIKFDENFGKDKIELINTALGDDSNEKMIFQKFEK